MQNLSLRAASFYLGEAYATKLPPGKLVPSGNFMHSQTSWRLVAIGSFSGNQRCRHLEPLMPFRILSLDGGGSWSIIQVRVLQDLYGEDTLGHDVLKNFQLAAANSGGSIVLGALLANMRLSEVLNLYLSEATRQALFQRLSFLKNPVKRATHAIFNILPQFSSDAKLRALQKILGNTGTQTLTDLHATIPKCPHLLIPAFNYDTHRATFFRSDINSAANASQGQPGPELAQAIHASSTAPVNFFDHPAEFSFPGNAATSRFWDGAIGGYNNPVQAAALEVLANATKYLRADQDIRVLSIGTPLTALPSPSDYSRAFPCLVQARQTSSILSDIKRLASSIVDDPPDAASFAAHIMLGGKATGNYHSPVQNGPVVRLNPLIQPKLEGNQWQLPNKNTPPIGSMLDEISFAALAKMDMAAVGDTQIMLIQRLCDAWMAGNAPNQAIQSTADFQVLIGHRYYDEAVAAWRLLAAL